MSKKEDLIVCWMLNDIIVNLVLNNQSVYSFYCYHHWSSLGPGQDSTPILGISTTVAMAYTQLFYWWHLATHLFGNMDLFIFRIIAFWSSYMDFFIFRNIAFWNLNIFQIGWKELWKTDGWWFGLRQKGFCQHHHG